MFADVLLEVFFLTKNKDGEKSLSGGFLRWNKIFEKSYLGFPGVWLFACALDKCDQRLYLWSPKKIKIFEI